MKQLGQTTARYKAIFAGRQTIISGSAIAKLSRHSITVLYVLGAVIVIFLIASYSRNARLLFDESYNLNLIRTFVNEGIYGTHMYEGYQYFDPNVSIGPPITISAAVFFHFSDINAATTRNFVTVSFVIHLLLLWFAVRSLFGFHVASISVIVIAVMPWFLIGGLQILGEVPAVSLFFGGLAAYQRGLEASKSKSMRWMLLAGVAFGLSFLSKELIIIGLLAILIRLVIDKSYLGMRWTTFLYGLVPLILSLLFIGAWRGFQIIAVSNMSPETAAEWWKLSGNHYQVNWQYVLFAPFQRVGAAIRDLAINFGPQTFGFLVLVIAYVSQVRSLVRSIHKPYRAQFAHHVLMIAATLWLGWYVLLSGISAYTRHLVIGVVFSVAATVQIAWIFWHSPPNPIAKVEHLSGFSFRVPWLKVLAVGSFLLFIVGFAVHVQWNQRFITKGSNVPQTETTEWVIDHLSPDDGIAGWGWYVPWDISFLSARFPTEVDLSMLEEPKANWFILTPELVASKSGGEQLQTFVACLGQPAFRNTQYEIYYISQYCRKQMFHPQQ
ncbi:MAG: glycosyltransferase family 39 protein [Anaerolineae bacterium]